MLFVMPAVFFLAVLVVAHLFVFVWQQPKRRWLVIDYLWLAVGALGILGAVSRVRQTEAEADLRLADATRRFTHEIQYAQQILDEIIEMPHQKMNEVLSQTVTETPPQSEIDDPNKVFLKTPTLSRSREISETGIFQFKNKARELRSVVDSSSIDSEWAKVFTATAETPDRIDLGVIELSVGQRLFGDVTSAVQDAHEEQRVIREIREERRGKWYEMQLVVMTPYLLGLGIALRVAKVTAELYGFREVSIEPDFRVTTAL